MKQEYEDDLVLEEVKIETKTDLTHQQKMQELLKKLDMVIEKTEARKTKIISSSR